MPISECVSSRKSPNMRKTAAVLAAFVLLPGISIASAASTSAGTPTTRRRVMRRPAGMAARTAEGASGMHRGAALRAAAFRVAERSVSHMAAVDRAAACRMLDTAEAAREATTTAVITAEAAALSSFPGHIGLDPHIPILTHIRVHIIPDRIRRIHRQTPRLPTRRTMSRAKRRNGRTGIIAMSRTAITLM